MHIVEDPRPRTRLLAVALSLAVFSFVQPAAAQKGPPKAFQEKYFDAETAYRLGKLDEAETLYKEAAKIYKAAGVYRGLAAVYVERAELSDSEAVKSKSYKQCLWAAFAALKMNPKSRTAGELRKIHAECRKGLGRPTFRGKLGKGQGVLAVMTDEIGAQVQINGNFAGATPLRPRPINSGRAVVVVTMVGGRKPVSRSAVVDILDGVVTDLVIDFSKKE